MAPRLWQKGRLALELSPTTSMCDCSRRVQNAVENAVFDDAEEMTTRSAPYQPSLLKKIYF